jgi:hypothetical protein
VAQDKYLSLEEARKLGKLKEFAKEHPEKGNKPAFDKLFNAMASGTKPAKRRTSGGERDGG